LGFNKVTAVSLGVILSISLIPYLVDNAFAGPPVPDPVQLGDFKCWSFTDFGGPQSVGRVSLEDQQFGESGTYDVELSPLWCNPATKGDGFPSPSPEPLGPQHYNVYNLCNNPASGDNCGNINRPIVIHDQFGDHVTTVLDPIELWAPAEKLPGDFNPGQSVDLDSHYLCYKIEPYLITESGFVFDQFFTPPQSNTLVKAFKFCTPADKTLVTGQTFSHNNPQDLVCYDIEETTGTGDSRLNLVDQFGGFTKVFGSEDSLCIVATKTFPPEPAEPVGGTVLLPDSVSLLLLEAESSAVLWLPAVIIAGAGIALIKIRKN